MRKFTRQKPKPNPLPSASAIHTVAAEVHQAAAGPMSPIDEKQPTALSHHPQGRAAVGAFGPSSLAPGFTALDVHKLQREIADCRKENEHLRQTNVKLFEENRQLQDSLPDHSSTVLHSLAEWREVQQLVEQITEENKSLRAEAKEAIAAYSVLKRENENFFDRLNEAEAERLNLSQAHELLKLEHNALKTHCQKIQHDSDQKISHLEYKRSFQECRNLLEQLKSKHQLELSHAAKENVEHRSDKKALALKLAEYEAKLSLVNAELQTVREQHKQIQRENFELTASFGTLTADHQRNELALKDLASTGDRLLVEKRTIVAEASAINESLQTTIAELHARIQRSESDNRKLKAFKHKALIVLSDAKQELKQRTL